MEKLGSYIVGVTWARQLFLALMDVAVRDGARSAHPADVEMLVCSSTTMKVVKCELANRESFTAHAS